MDPRKNIVAISGSTRPDSTNQHLIQAIAGLTTDLFKIVLYEGISTLPHFNPEQVDHAGELVDHFRQLLKEADGVLICTPEYAHGVPGSLKNAIDWVVGTGEFSHKPVLLITASTDGQYGHKALLETLRVLEAKNIDQLQLLIPFARTRINTDRQITDKQTLKEIQERIEQFYHTM